MSQELYLGEIFLFGEMLNLPKIALRSFKRMQSYYPSNVMYANSNTFLICTVSKQLVNVGVWRGF